MISRAQSSERLVLAVNVGSSSLRLSLFLSNETGLQILTERHTGQPEAEAESMAIQLGDFLASAGVESPKVVVHRIVHGGQYDRPCLLDESVRTAIADLAPLAPLHNPAALAWVEACTDRFGTDAAQVAVFDTAFFNRLPEVASQYAIPAKLASGPPVRRYGFHGLAHQGLWQAWQTVNPEAEGRGRLISLQLGSGCSIAAIEDGEARDTSMGFTPLEGLVMASRCGDLDPGLLIYLQRNQDWSLEQLDRLLSRQSGLLGLSGISADMRELINHPDPRAELAVDVYCYRVRKYIGAYLTVLGGADAIVFGGGVGENSPEIRARILGPLAWLGVKLDEKANRDAVAKQACISSPDSSIQVWVTPVDEARLMVEQALALVAVSEKKS